jgi:hypothetical protein
VVNGHDGGQQEQTRRSFTGDYKAGAVMLVLDDGKTVAGSPRIHEDLIEQAEYVSRKRVIKMRVARLILMLTNGRR